MSGNIKRTSFNSNWLHDPRFSAWIASAKSKTKARCNTCAVSFELGNMGRQALLSHARGKKHILKMGLTSSNKHQNTWSSYCVAKPSKEEGPEGGPPIVQGEIILVPPPQTTTMKASRKEITCYFSKSDTLTAEVLWAIKVLMDHYSFSSSSGTDKRFAKMFSDSQIAKNFQCGATKCSYLICFGLGPHSHQQLIQKLQEPGTKYVISFDESFNKVHKQEQMDLDVRFWDTSKGKLFPGTWTLSSLVMLGQTICFKISSWL